MGGIVPTCMETGVDASQGLCHAGGVTPITGSHRRDSAGRVGHPPAGPRAQRGADVLAASPLTAAFRGTASVDLPPDDRAAGLPSIDEAAAELDAAEIAIQP